MTPSTYIWAVASDSQGNAYLATGSPATVLKVTPDGVSTKLFTSKDLSVQAVRVGPDGSVYAATLPGGKVYRIRPGQTDLDESSAAVVFDSATLARNSGRAKPADQPRYIWALVFDAQGALYIATGRPCRDLSRRCNGSHSHAGSSSLKATSSISAACFSSQTAI